MPELTTIDVAVANRFISSLSKSLQALCHGCMDFNSGIEIVGYININIDSGSKVDYVLNEKVLKSNTNSMTFVSNSFLAKKDQPKQLRDGACSPVPELQPQKGSFHQSGFQHHRSVFPYSSQSHVLRGAHKRAWSGMERDWRTSPKKHPRGGRASYPIPQPQSYQSGFSSETLSKQVPSVTHSSIEKPEIPSSASGVDSNVNIKKEIADYDDNNGTEQGASVNSFNKDNLNSESLENRLNIKSDPDAIPEAKGDKTLPSSDTSTDIKVSFLNPASESENPDDTGETFQNPSVEEDNYSKLQHSMNQDDQCASETPVGNEQSGDSNLIPSTSEMPVEYDEAEDMSYPNPYHDQAEGSGDGDHFDVIEIDDEDEDVKAMFGDNGAYMEGRQSPPEHFLHTDSSSSGNAMTSRTYKCDFCPVLTSSLKLYRQHVAFKHSHNLPFKCPICEKGFITNSTLLRHIRDHGERRFMCPICDLRFKRKYHIQRHLKNQHQVQSCPKCSQLFNSEAEFNYHVSQCGRYN